MQFKYIFVLHLVAYVSGLHISEGNRLRRQVENADIEIMETGDYGGDEWTNFGKKYLGQSNIQEEHYINMDVGNKMINVENQLRSQRPQGVRRTERTYRQETLKTEGQTRYTNIPIHITSRNSVTDDRVIEPENKENKMPQLMVSENTPMQTRYQRRRPTQQQEVMKPLTPTDEQKITTNTESLENRNDAITYSQNAHNAQLRTLVTAFALQKVRGANKISENLETIPSQASVTEPSKPRISRKRTRGNTETISNQDNTSSPLQMRPQITQKINKKQIILIDNEEKLLTTVKEAATTAKPQILRKMNRGNIKNIPGTTRTIQSSTDGTKTRTRGRIVFKKDDIKHAEEYTDPFVAMGSDVDEIAYKIRNTEKIKLFKKNNADTIIEETVPNADVNNFMIARKEGGRSRGRTVYRKGDYAENSRESIPTSEVQQNFESFEEVIPVFESKKITKEMTS